jgi:hypothetical protein
MARPEQRFELPYNRRTHIFAFYSLSGVSISECGKAIKQRKQVSAKWRMALPHPIAQTPIISIVTNPIKISI